MTSEILIPTNGFEGTWPSIEYGAWLAKTLGTKATLLGLNETLSPDAIDEPQHPLEEVFEYAIRVFQQHGVEYRLDIQNGSAEQVIPQRANQSDVIVVLGKFGRPMIRQFLSGRSIRHFIEEIKQPIIYVPGLKLPVKKILVCIGGLGYEVTDEDLIMQIASKYQAEITLLNVVPPIDFEYPTARALRENWQHPEQTITPIGQSLRKSLEVAKAAGLNATVSGRQGNVVEEILSEVRKGNYDLLCMGSSYSMHSLRQMYSPNVTVEIVGAVNCPILTARYKSK
jgi:nucleotide-binding universal stress UspA family protein